MVVTLPLGFVAMWRRDFRAEGRRDPELDGTVYAVPLASLGQWRCE
jgi:hypothetical protein